MSRELTVALAESGLSDDVRSARRAFRQRWRDGGLYSQMTLGQLLASGGRKLAGTQLVFSEKQGDRIVTLAEIAELGERVAGGLHEMGMRHGDAIAIQLPNSPELVATYVAAARIGMVLVPIVPFYGRSEIEYILKQTGARLLVAAGALRAGSLDTRVGELSEYPDLERVVVVGDGARHGDDSWSTLANGTASTEPPFSGSADSVTMVMFTSGTTAEPKGVVHTHNSLIAELTYSPTPPAEGVGATLQPFPAGHIAGVVSVLGPFVHGRTTVLLDAWSAQRAARLIDDHAVDSMAGTPFYINELLAAEDLGASTLRSLKYVMTGGAGVPPSLIEAAELRGWSVVRCYGASEQPSATAGDHGADLEVRANLDGSPVGGASLRVIDPDGAEVAEGEIGEITLIGPEQFAGYLNPDHNVGAFTADGWFRTGDIGFVRGGVLKVVDRLKDIIIRGGENISSAEVENVLVRHPAVAEAAVVGMPDPRFGERVFAFVVLNENATLTMDDIAAHFAGSGLARHKTPEGLRLVTEMPRTPAGKIRKPDLRALLAGT